MASRQPSARITLAISAEVKPNGSRPKRGPSRSNRVSATTDSAVREGAEGEARVAMGDGHTQALANQCLRRRTVLQQHRVALERLAHATAPLLRGDPVGRNDPHGAGAIHHDRTGEWCVLG